MPIPSLSQIFIPWIESPWWKEFLNEMHMDEHMRSLAEAYARDGYLILTIPEAEFTPYAEGIRAALEEPLSTTDRIQDAWKTLPAARSLATLPLVINTLQALYSRRPVPFQTLHFKKGTQQKTHSDALHFHTIPARFMCGAWVALEDVDDSNGPLHVYPGSHRLPVLEQHNFGLAAELDVYGFYEDAMQRFIEEHHLQKKVLHVKKGQVVIWAANVLHGGEPIQNFDRTRWSQVTHYVFENCLAYSPRRSDLSRGKVFPRLITDVGTGKIVPPMIDGKIVKLTAEQEFWMRPSIGVFLRAVGSRVGVGLRRRMKK